MAASRISVVATEASASFNVTVPSGCRGIHILIASGAQVTAVSVGGVSATEAPNSPADGVANEVANLFCSSWLIGSSVPAAGTRAVSITGPGGPDSLIEFIGADDDVEYVDSDNSIDGSVLLTNPSTTLSLGGRECVCALIAYSGHTSVGSVTPLTNWTAQFEFDLGSTLSFGYTYDIVGTSDVTAGWSQTSEDALAMCVAIAQVAGGGGDISATGSLSVTGAADLDATGSLGAAGALSIAGAADLDAVGSLSAAGAVSITGSASLTGAAANDLAATGSIAISGVASLNATGTIAAAGALSITGAADVDATGSLAAVGSVSVIGTADLDATGSLSAVGSLAINGVAELTEADNPNMSAAGSLSISGTAALNAIGQLAAAGSISIAGAADLEYPNELQAVGSLLISGSADLDATGALSAAGQIAILGAALLVDANAAVGYLVGTVRVRSALDGVTRISGALEGTATRIGSALDGVPSVTLSS